MDFQLEPFNLFFIYKSLRYILLSFASIGFSVQEFKIDFQDGGRGVHLGFPIEKIVAIIDLQAIPILPIKFRVNLSFGSAEEFQNRFSKWQQWQPS